MDYEIITDTGANLSDEYILKNTIKIVPIFTIENGEEVTLTDKELYQKMRDGIHISTAAPSDTECKDIFEKVLKEGRDLLYLGFSSGLSATFSVSKRVLDELKQTYPNRQIYYVDSLSATLGQGRLFIEALKMRNAGGDIKTVYDWLLTNVPKSCHLFTVETLKYLHRGGRLNKSSYLIGSVLQIKPVMHVNNTGHLEPIGKVIGRRRSLNSIAEKVAESIEEPEKQTVYIVHGDCEEDAKYLAKQIENRIKVAGFEYSMLNALIGAHAGPGTIAVFFAGKQR
ncbi:MAG: DegV family protein [Christensenellaceae bacterium]|jgi:DegV family protein with EDD domain|nr:DegV family protein [Christensenellaceae bacterium]